MYQSIPSQTIPSGDHGDSHILVAPGVGFSSPSLARGVLNQCKSSIILKKSAIFALSLKQLSSSSFHMFIYARSEPRDSVPIYTITNTERIRIYPGKVKFILVKISSAPGQRNQILFTFLTTENLSGLSCSHKWKYGEYSNLFSYTIIYTGRSLSR